MRQTEYLLKGLYLGLVFFAALQQAEATPAGSWDSLARVNLSTLTGLGLNDHPGSPQPGVHGGGVWRNPLDGVNNCLGIDVEPHVQRSQLSRSAFR